jgi:hypothetical protein
VTVTTSGGTNALTPATAFTYAPSPAVSAVTPSRGLTQGGTGVLLGGSGFTPNSTVDFGPNNPGKVLRVTSDGTLMAVRAPPGSGTVNVIVTSGGNSSVPAKTNRFRYEREAPRVIAIRPGSGPSSGGYGLLIGGRQMNGAISVHFGTTAAKIVSRSSDGDIVAVIVPPGVGTVDVTVTTSSGTSDNVTGDHFTYTGG